MSEILFEAFPKIPRWKREIICTEKIDGTNAQIYVPEDPTAPLLTGSRNRWITPEQDNYGFARWAQEHTEELRALGPGRHFGEWWGPGIQRRYGIAEKRFSLFNTSHWTNNNPPPACCHVVPVLWAGVNTEENIEACLAELKTNGSKASPGFMLPEGIVIFHVSSRQMFKRTIEKDDEPKGAVTT